MRRDEKAEQVERYLDTQVGFFSRLLPWREEMASHLAESYENALDGTGDPEEAWRHARASFGEVRAVARDLRRESIPDHLLLRLLVAGVALLAMLSAAGIAAHTFIDFPSGVLVFGPGLLGVVLLGLTRDLSFRRVRRLCLIGAGAATIAGFIIVMATADTSTVGKGLAVSLICPIYALLLVPPRRALFIFLAICLVELLSLARFGFPLYHWPLQGFGDLNWALPAASMAGCAAAGTILFGLARATTYRFHIAAAATLVAHMMVLYHLESIPSVAVLLACCWLPMTIALIPDLGRGISHFSAARVP